MWQKIKEFILGKTPLELEHEFFGKMLFMRNHKSNENGYWEAELSVPGVKDGLTVLINASIEGPSEKQKSFCQAALADLDSLFEKCWPAFEPDFNQWTNMEYSGNWRDHFELMSIEIPEEGDEKNEWTVGYFVNSANHYFTARFSDGEAKFNEIDG